MYSTFLLDWNKFPKNERNNNLFLLNPEHRSLCWLTHLLSNCCNVSTVPNGVVDVFQHACFKVTRSVCSSQISLEFLQKYKDHLIFVALKRCEVWDTCARSHTASELWSVIEIFRAHFSQPIRSNNLNKSRNYFQVFSHTSFCVMLGSFKCRCRFWLA